MHGRDSLEKDTGVFISTVHQGDVCTQPMDRQVYGRLSVRPRLAFLPFSSLLSSSVCVGLRPHASGPCFSLAFNSLSSLFLPTSFHFKVWEEKLRLYIIYRTYITPWDPGPTSEREQGREEGGGAGREWERERMSTRMNQPASVLDALGQVPHPCSTQEAKRGRVTATERAAARACVCVCTRVRVRAILPVRVLSSQKRMSVCLSSPKPPIMVGYVSLYPTH